MVNAINEFAISMTNYYIGLLNLEPKDFKDLDKDIRKILIKNKIQYKPAAPERLYLPRSELGRGLINVEHRSELIMYSMNAQFEYLRNTSPRRAAILAEENEASSHFSLIKTYIKNKYEFSDEEIQDKGFIEKLKQAQKSQLCNDINKKILHSKLHRCKENQMVSLADSSLWLRKSTLSPREEGALCFLQDRNVFYGMTNKCPHCGKEGRSVDHLATKCNRMLKYDYTWRHDEIVKILHLKLCTEYGLKSDKRVRNHYIQEVLANERAEIRVDTRIKTDIKIEHHRPDIFVHDKQRNIIKIIEVGVTCQDRLAQMEAEKFRKYDLLANELQLIYKARVQVIPYVMTWEGVVTKCHQKYVEAIKLTPKIEAYIQTRVLKKTLDSISMDYRRGTAEMKAQTIVLKAQKLVENAEEEQEKAVKKVKMVGNSN